MKRKIAIVLFVCLFLFVATWYYRCILLLLALAVFWRKSLKKWFAEHIKYAHAFTCCCLIVALLVVLLMPKPYSFGRVKLYYQNENYERTSAPVLQVICNAILPEEEIMNVGIHAALFGSAGMQILPPYMRMGERFLNMVKHDALHGKIGNFYFASNALERNFNTPMSGTYAQGFEWLGIQHSRSVYVIRPKHFDKDKKYPLVVFCHGYLGNWQLYQGVLRDLDNCVVLSIGTKDLSGIFTHSDIQKIFTKQIPFVESLGYKIDKENIHLMGLSNGGTACRVAYRDFGNRFKSITAISTGCGYLEYGWRKCRINLIGGGDCPVYPGDAKRYRAIGMDAECLYDANDNHFILVNQRQRIIDFLNRRLHE